MSGINISCQVLPGGESTVVSISGTSAQSAVLVTGSYLVTPLVDCFTRLGAVGASPTALANGTDQILLAGNTYRILPIVAGQKFAFITSGTTSSVYLTPNA